MSEIHSLIDILQEKIMIIYRSILQQNNVLIVSKEQPISVFNEKMKTLENLMYPINFSEKFRYYDSLSGMKILSIEKGFVAGFNNPIIKNYQIGDIYVDLDTGEVYKQNLQLTHNDVTKCDFLFISKILKLKKISQEKIRKSFANYTRM